MRTLAPTHTTTDFCKPQKLAQEYNHLYFSRLSALAPQIVAKNPFPGPECTDILRSTGTIWFVGTIYREMKKKPNMIDDVYKINHGELPVHPEVFATELDKTYIEPRVGRPMPIRGQIGDLVTGCVVALRGHIDHDHFVVEEAAPLGFESPPPPPPSASPGKVLFLSGLLLDASLYNPRVSLLLDWLSGYVEDTSLLTQVVICGNSLREPPAQLIGSRVTRPVLGASAIFDFVKLIKGVVRDLPVHLMPGERDPAPVALPQKPFHKGLFSAARDMLDSQSLILDSNPAAFATNDGVHFLGSSGQPIRDLLRYDPKLSCLELMCRTLEWGHLCPTAPDTVPTYPYADTDPLVIEAIPHVYFAGNMPEFGTCVYKGVRVVAVPEFHSTGQVVELDLATLEAEVVAVA